mmetsp:Transcript_20948/g.45830  ORF Transcript_20948/g.45830 Transcript_20948/m.45830 type:complete len:215 (-) Transcript_20948:1500-2144(-)
MGSMQRLGGLGDRSSGRAPRGMYNVKNESYPVLGPCRPAHDACKAGTQSPAMICRASVCLAIEFQYLGVRTCLSLSCSQFGSGSTPQESVFVAPIIQHTDEDSHQQSLSSSVQATASCHLHLDCTVCLDQVGHAVLLRLAVQLSIDCSLLTHLVLVPPPAKALAALGAGWRCIMLNLPQQLLRLLLDIVPDHADGADMVDHLESVVKVLPSVRG